MLLRACMKNNNKVLGKTVFKESCLFVAVLLVFSAFPAFAQTSGDTTNLISNSDAATTSGYEQHGGNISVTAETVNNENYVKASCTMNDGATTPGIFPIGGNIAVTPGETYILKVKGYRITATNANLYFATVSNTDLVWPGALLPLGSANENWVSNVFTVPAGVTSVKVGVLLSLPGQGDGFYINKISLTKVQAKIIYVRQGATGGNGSSWSTAFSNLQDALAVASGSSDTKEIWVARGEYRPTAGSDRSISFQLPPQTFIYGGFAGTETAKGTRNWTANRTVLSGDLGAFLDKSDNSYHVITAKNVDGNSGIDGFIITDGNANGAADASHNNSGGGMLILGTSSTTRPKINNCEFINNTSILYGGGLATISEGSSVSAEITNCFLNGNSSSNGGGAVNYRISESNTSSFVNCSFSTNHATAYGGALANIGSAASVINGTFSMNNALTNGGAIYNSNSSSASIRNSILWKNFKGSSPAGSAYNQIFNNQATPVIQYNIIQGGYGVAADQNTNADPLFVKDPSFIGKFPRTSIIPVEYTEPKYEKLVRFSGTRLPNTHTYFTYKDSAYNKLYLIGRNLQIIDFGNLTDGLPTSTIRYELDWGRIQRMENLVHEGTNKIYVGNGGSGVMSIDRVTGATVSLNVLAGEPITLNGRYKAEDVIVDNESDLLYAPIFLYPRAGDIFYGLLELNLMTNAKRWITTTSSPISIPAINNAGDDLYWNGHRLYLDKVSNTLYYSTGYGVWWWNRTNNTTGVYSTQGGIPLKAGNPGLPSDLTTGMYIDHAENKFYIGTHAGLFVWDRTNNTSRVYNTQNSLLMHNLINTVDKNEAKNLIYVACEMGGLFVLNTITGEQKLLKKDVGNEVYPQMPDTNTASAYFDKVENKLYVNTDSPSGGSWIWDYNNLLPDYGDLKLKTGSPAIDKANAGIFPSSVTVDITGLNRHVKTLDLGAYEKTYACPQPLLDFQFTKLNGVHTFTPVLTGLEEGCNVQYTWSFGDNTSSSESSPDHSFASTGTYSVTLRVSYSCGSCPASETVKVHEVLIENSLCGNIYCDDNGGVGIDTEVIPVGYRLAVKGKVVMEGGKIITHSRWPDYVFEKDYKLMSLPALKEFIAENGHLPNIPSAETVKKEGVDVGEMSILLLQKTEELTLHLIGIEERLKKLETEEKTIKK
jgi:hypothetical protein